MSETTPSPTSPENPLEKRVEELSGHILEKLQLALDEYQKLNPTEDDGFPGPVEGTLQECWEQFLDENKLTSSVFIQIGAGDIGNACGFMPMVTDSLPIYVNSDHYLSGPLPSKFSERLLYENIKTSIASMIANKELREK